MTYVAAPPAPRLVRPLYSETDVIVMTMVAAGQSQRQIAKRLGVPRYSVQSRLCRLYARIGAANAPHAVALLIGAGVIAAPRTEVASHARP